MTPETSLLATVDERRSLVAQGLDPEKRAELAQYFTPSAVAWFMAGLLRPRGGTVRLLDPGAGVGPLAAAAVVALMSATSRPERLEVVAYELDEGLEAPLRQTLGAVATWAASEGVPCEVEVRRRDFLADVAAGAAGPRGADGYDLAILNPPYGKARRGSLASLAERVGVEVPNIYAAFWAAAVASVAPGGDVVAITPRSFCNGTYFRRFRVWLLQRASLEQVHVYDSRTAAFRADAVLQETVVTRLVVGASQSPEVAMTAQAHPGAEARSRSVPYARVVQPADAESFIHVVPDAEADVAAARMAAMTCTLDDLGLTVSTGRVVDFRSTEHLRMTPAPGDIPLLYPHNLRGGSVQWPRAHAKKCAALSGAAVEAGLTVPDGDYVLVKRLSSKEETRRVSAAWLPGGSLGAADLGFENHLNYFHQRGGGLDRELAVGLAVYLNCSMVDDYIRQFSGHTQVNAGDLRALRYPGAQALKEAGSAADCAVLASREATDNLAAEVLLQT